MAHRRAAKAAGQASPKAKVQPKAKAQPRALQIVDQFTATNEWQYCVAFGNIELRQWPVEAVALLPGPDTYIAKWNGEADMQLRKQVGKECRAPLVLKGYLTGNGVQMSGTDPDIGEVLIMSPLDDYNDFMVNANYTPIAIQKPMVAQFGDGIETELVEITLHQVPLPFYNALKEYSSP